MKDENQVFLPVVIPTGSMSTICTSDVSSARVGTPESLAGLAPLTPLAAPTPFSLSPSLSCLFALFALPLSTRTPFSNKQAV